MNQCRTLLDGSGVNKKERGTKKKNLYFITNSRIICAFKVDKLFLLFSLNAISILENFAIFTTLHRHTTFWLLHKLQFLNRK